MKKLITLLTVFIVLFIAACDALPEVDVGQQEPDDGETDDAPDQVEEDDSELEDLDRALEEMEDDEDLEDFELDVFE